MPTGGGYGRLEVSRTQGPDGSGVRIDRADPWILVSGELWAELALGAEHARVEGDLLTVTDSAGTQVAYRRQGPGPEPATWACERQDPEEA